MAPLKNARHERFVGLLLEGKDATDAYEGAGFKRDDGNASRLKNSPGVAARLTEMQNEIAAKVPVTIESLIGELEEVRSAATSKSQYAAAVRAVLGKAQLSGLLVERQKVEVGGPGSFDDLDDEREIALRAVDDEVKFKIEPYHDYTEADRQRLAEIFLEFVNTYNSATQKVIDEIRARPTRTNFKLHKTRHLTLTASPDTDRQAPTTDNP
jgi:hypothetical protein